VRDCKHFTDDVNLLSWRTGFGPGVANLVCAKCHSRVSQKRHGEYEAWGPATNTPETAIEVRAAEIAGVHAEGRCLLSYAVELVGTEYEGWRGAETIDLHVVDADGNERDDSNVPLNLDSPNWLAGYLARCITEHAEEGKS
jgi:hypothetical protein